MRRNTLFVFLGLVFLLGTPPVGAPDLLKQEQGTGLPTSSEVIGEGCSRGELYSGSHDSGCPGERWSHATKACVCAPSGMCTEPVL